MNSALFELNNWTDLLKKARHDFARLDELVNSYDLFNLLCTVNHVPDWIEKDPMVEDVIRHKSELLKRENPNVKVVRELCNRAKHFAPWGTSPKTEQESGYDAGRYGKGSFGVGEPSYEVEVNGRMMNVVDVLRDALSEWEKLQLLRQP